MGLDRWEGNQLTNEVSKSLKNQRETRSLWACSNRRKLPSGKKPQTDPESRGQPSTLNDCGEKGTLDSEETGTEIELESRLGGESERPPPPGHRHCWLVQPSEWHTVGKADPILFKGNDNNLGCWHLKFAPLNLLVTVAFISHPRSCRTIRRSEDMLLRTPESPRRTRWSRHRGQQIGFYALCALDVLCSVSTWPLEQCEGCEINCGDPQKNDLALRCLDLMYYKRYDKKKMQLLCRTPECTYIWLLSWKRLGIKYFFGVPECLSPAIIYTKEYLYFYYLFIYY